MTNKIDLEPGETCPHCGQKKRKKVSSEATKARAKKAAQARWAKVKEKEQQEAINKLNNK